MPSGNPGATPAPQQGKPQFQGDPQHTGRSQYGGPRQLSLVRSLQAPTPRDPATSARPDDQSDPVVGADGTIYVSIFSGLLLAVGDSGRDQLSVKWQFEQAKSSGYHQTPAMGRDGSVLLGISTSQNPSTTIFDFKAPASGTEPQVAWKYDLGQGRMTSSMTVGADGSIYAIGGTGKLAVLNPDGSLKWTAQAGQSAHAAPALAGNGLVYLPSTDGNLYAVVPPAAGGSTGAIIWKSPFGDRAGVPKAVGKTGGEDAVGSSSSPTVGPDGTVYLGANNSNFYAFNPDGTQKWKFEAEPEIAGIWTSGVLSADGRTIYFGANKGGMYALRTSDGSKVWEAPLFGGSIYASPALDRNGTLYVGTTTGHVFALDSSTGNIVSVADTGAAVWSAPSLRPDGSLATVNREGKVMVFGG
jgi:outer membrane protein assembly factor BamB